MVHKASSLLGLVAAMSLGFNNVAFAYAPPLQGTLAEQITFESQLALYRSAKAVLAFDPKNIRAEMVLLTMETALHESPVSKGLNMDIVLNSRGCAPGDGTTFAGGASCHAIRHEDGEDGQGLPCPHPAV